MAFILSCIYRVCFREYQPRMQDTFSWRIMVTDIDPAAESYDDITNTELDHSKIFEYQLVGFEGPYATPPEKLPEGTIRPPSNGM